MSADRSRDVLLALLTVAAALWCPVVGQCADVEQALNRKIEFYPAGELKGVIDVLAESTGITIELADPADGVMPVRPSYTDNMVLRKGLTKHLARIVMTWEIEDEKILIAPTERFARHKKAENRLKEIGVTVTRISEKGRLGVQDYSAEFTWWTQVEIRGKWNGMGDEFGLIRNLIDVTQLRLIDVDAAHDALEQLRELRPTTLVIVNCDIRDEDLRPLSGMRDLWHLQLEGLKVRGEGLRHVAGADGLRWLSLAYCPIDDEQLQHVARFKSLHGLRLANTPVGDAGLAQLDGLEWLGHLNLEGTAITDEGLQHLKRLKSISRLDLDKTRITDEGLARLAEIKPGLHVLQCGWTYVSNDGMKSLAKMPNLSTLSIEKTSVSRSGLREISDAGNVGSLSIHDLLMRPDDLRQFARPQGKPALIIWDKPQSGEMDNTMRAVLEPSTPWTNSQFEHEPTDLERIQGRWVSLADEEAKDVIPVTDYVGVITGNSAIGAGGTVLNFFFELDPTAMPKTIRLFLWDKKGKEFVYARGIYKFDGDNLIVCYGDDGDRNKPPKGFPRNEDEGLSVVTFKKYEP